MDVENRFVTVVLKNQRDEYSVRKRLEERNAGGFVVVYEDDSELGTTKRSVKDYHSQKRYSLACDRPDADVSPSATAGNLNETPAFYTIKIPGHEVKNMTGLSKKQTCQSGFYRKN